MMGRISEEIDEDEFIQDRIDADINEGQFLEYQRREMEEERALLSLERRIRRLEKKYGFRRHRIIFEAGRNVYDRYGNLLVGHIPKLGETFYSKPGDPAAIIEREVGVAYLYPPLDLQPGMPWIEMAHHEIFEEMEDERDKPAVDAINGLVKCLDDLIVSILKDEGTSPQLLQLAIAKRDEVAKLLSQVGEDIYQAREKVVDKLVDLAIRRTAVTEGEKEERLVRLEKEGKPLGKRDQAFKKCVEREEVERAEALRLAVRKLLSREKKRREEKQA